MIPEGNRHSDTGSERSPDHKRIRFPPWLITYSDLMTLLLTFFILLMSMADLDPVRFSKASNSLKGAFGIRPQQSGKEIIVPVFPAAPVSELDPVQSAVINKIYQNLQLQIEDFAIKDSIQTSKPRSDTLLVRINNSLLFDIGEDRLLPAALPFLDKVALSIKNHAIDVRIEGHADKEEVLGQFSNYWELATARSVSVLRYFVQNRQLGIDRLSAVGYGSERPVVTNPNNKNRSLNRRVDIVLQANFGSGTTPASNHRSDVPL